MGVGTGVAVGGDGGVGNVVDVGNNTGVGLGRAAMVALTHDSTVWTTA